MIITSIDARRIVVLVLCGLCIVMFDLVMSRDTVIILEERSGYMALDP